MSMYSSNVYKTPQVYNYGLGGASGNGVAKVVVTDSVWTSVLVLLEDQKIQDATCNKKQTHGNKDNGL